MDTFFVSGAQICIWKVCPPSPWRRNRRSSPWIFLWKLQTDLPQSTKTKQDHSHTAAESRTNSHNVQGSLQCLRMPKHLQAQLCMLKKYLSVGTSNCIFESVSKLINWCNILLIAKQNSPKCTHFLTSSVYISIYLLQLYKRSNNEIVSLNVLVTDFIFKAYWFWFV